MQEPTTLGADFAAALAAKDSGRMLDLMHPEIDFRGMTPSNFWEAGDPEAVVSVLLRKWFEESDEIEALEHLERKSSTARDQAPRRSGSRSPPTSAARSGGAA
jgi:hypothetical protein